MTAKHTNTDTPNTDTSGTYPCPTCQKPTHWQDNPSRPFCSHRCKLIDLGDWAAERYRIAGDDKPIP